MTAQHPDHAPTPAEAECEHCEAVAREWCMRSVAAWGDVADLLQRERASLLARAEAAERDRSDVVRVGDAMVADLRAKLAEAEADATAARSRVDAREHRIAELEAAKAAAEARVAELEADTRCSFHAGQSHGKEAEELRAGVESIIANVGTRAGMVTELRELLDRVDARDSLMHVEAIDELEAIEEERDEAIARAERAEAAAAQMRTCIEALLSSSRGLRPSFASDSDRDFVVQWRRAVDAARELLADTDAGKGYLSPEQVAQACAAARDAALEAAAVHLRRQALFAREHNFLADGVDLDRYADEIRTLKVTP